MTDSTEPPENLTHSHFRHRNRHHAARRRTILVAIASATAACASTKPNPPKSDAHEASVPSSEIARSTPSASAPPFSSPLSSWAPPPASAEPSSDHQSAPTSSSKDPAPPTEPQPAPMRRPTTVPPQYKYCILSPATGCPSVESNIQLPWAEVIITKGPSIGKTDGKTVCCYGGVPKYHVGRPLSSGRFSQRKWNIATLHAMRSWI